MRVQRFSGSDNAYIPSSQPTYSGQLPYDEFLRRLTKANKVALQLNLDGGRQQWITFALTGSGTALAKIGAVRADSEPRRPSAAPAKTAPQAAKSAPENPAGRREKRFASDEMPSIPANAQLNRDGHDWSCVRGYVRSGDECTAVKIPEHAELNRYGNGWQCVRG